MKAAIHSFIPRVNGMFMVLKARFQINQARARGNLNLNPSGKIIASTNHDFRE
ncbi:hypothetical protein [Synechococcus sp. GEYO]|uniref:hypothetical protein n=1 Tax=Synechococcus sp. GEYO TaxID=2575511 RepID=UPI001481EF20|nr:hypothetical protein [Synechococcus sp. GEYO]